MKNKILATTILFFSLTSMPALAEDACTPAKDMVRMVKAFYAADGKYLNIIAVSYTHLTLPTKA